MTILARKAVFLGTALSVVLSLATVGARPAQAATNAVPAQFIAKMYSEVLGRSPDASGWASEISYFSGGSNCTQAGLKSRGRNFYLGTEFSNLGYDNAAKLLTLYHGVVNSETDQTSFDSNLASLNSGALTWTQMVDAFFDSTYFGNLVNAICATTTSNTRELPDPGAYYYGWDGDGFASADFNTIDAPNLPLTSGDTGFAGSVGGKTQEDLQTELDNAASTCGTVYLAQKSVTRIKYVPTDPPTAFIPLTVPSCVTLTTSNVSTAPPTTAQYALMGRLVRDRPDVAGIGVVLQPGAKMKNVWYDGRRNDPDNYANSAQSTDAGVVLAGGDGTQLVNSRVTNSNGFRAVAAAGTLFGYSTDCTNHLISGNFVTSYSTRRKEVSGADGAQSGIEIWCKSGTVSANTVVDATDWGMAIIVFGTSQTATDTPTPSNPNVSVIDGNVVFNAGNSLYTGIGYSAEGNNPSQILNFKGSSIKNNVLWASQRAHMTLAFQAGLRAHLGDVANRVDYPVFQDNQLGLNSSNPLITEQAYSMSAAWNASVTSTVSSWITNTNTGPNCPVQVITAAYTTSPAPSFGRWSTWLGGTGPTGWVDVETKSCIN